MNLNKKLICIIGFLDLMAVSMIIPLLLPEIVKRGASPTIAGLVSSIYGAVQLFSSPLMGRWSDRIGHRIALIICLLFISGCYGFLGLAATIPLLAFARFLLGFCKHSQTMCRTYLCDMSTPEEQTREISFFNASSSIGFIVGPTLGGHLAERPDGFFYVCTVTSLVFLINAGIVRFLLVPPRHEKMTKKTEDIPPSNKRLTWSQYIDIFSIRFLLSLSPLLYRSNFSLNLINRFQLSSRHIGYITSFQGFVSAVSGFSIGIITKFFPDNQKLTVNFVFLMFLSLLCLTFCPTVTFLLVCLFPLNLSTTVTRASVTKDLVDQTDPKDRGQLMGMSQSITSCARMLSPLLAGILQEWSDSAPGFVSSLICLSAFFILLTRFRNKVF